METKEIEEAIKILTQGGIVIFPTDTAFGIGCRIDDEKAIERLFKIRRRPQEKAVPVLVDSFEMAQEYLLPISKDVREKLIKPFWPGALTIILPCKLDKVPELVRGGGSNLGVRMPDNEVVLSLIGGVGVPILGSSANFSGGKTPFQFLDIDKELLSKVDYVVEGECKFKEPSTVIDCSVRPWKIIRMGVVKLIH